ncbi:MAG: nucleotidyltransferase domain-containing protein [Mariniphaga sp.]
MDQIDLYRGKLMALCELHKVQQVYLFGSILSTRFNESSDVDVLVQFGQIDLMEYFDNYMDFKEKLEELFQRPVDLVENQAIRNPIFRKVIDREKLLVYERKSA